MPSKRVERHVPILGREQPGRPSAPATLGRAYDGQKALHNALQVPIEQIVPDPEQPRKSIDEERLAELAASIAEQGILQPLLVREEGLLDDGRSRYMIIAGGRRYAAALQAGLTHLPVILRETAEGARLRVLQLLENLQRENLPPVEEARAMSEIMHLEHLSQLQLAERIHRSEGYVGERLRLLKHADVEDAVVAGLLTSSAGAAVATLSAERRRDWIERARRGETILAKDVWATKPRTRTSAQRQPPVEPRAAVVPHTAAPPVMQPDGGPSSKFEDRAGRSVAGSGERDIISSNFEDRGVSRPGDTAPSEQGRDTAERLVEVAAHTRRRHAVDGAAVDESVLEGLLRDVITTFTPTLVVDAATVRKVQEVIDHLTTFVAAHAVEGRR